MSDLQCVFLDVSEQCVSSIFSQYSFSRKSPGVGDVVSLAQLSRVKLASTAFSAQLSWFGRALLAPAVRHLKVRPLLIYNLDHVSTIMYLSSFRHQRRCVCIDWSVSQDPGVNVRGHVARIARGSRARLHRLFLARGEPDCLVGSTKLIHLLYKKVNTYICKKEKV